jgi:RNA polymerase sigma factor (sigma-70 family)
MFFVENVEKKVFFSIFLPDSSMNTDVIHTIVSEQELWYEFKQGNVEAYRKLYERFAPQLYNYGTKFTKDITIVEDAIQDLFYTLWTSRERLSQPPSVKNYLFKSLRTGVYKKLNKNNLLVNGEPSENFSFELAIDETLSQKDHLLQIKKQVEQALNSLTSRQREIIYYRFYQNLGFDEIADIMNMQVRATYKLTARALDTLRNVIPAGNLFSFLLLFKVI